MRLALILALSCASLPAQTLRALNTGTAAPNVLLNALPSGDSTVSGRFHTINGANFSGPGSDLNLWTTHSNFWRCYFESGSTNLVCLNAYDSTPGGLPEIDLAGLNDARFVYQRDRTGGSTQIDLWRGDCTGHIAAVRATPYGGGEPVTYTNPDTLAIGGGSGNISIDFIRSNHSLIGASPSCPTDAPAAAATNFDWPFEGGGGDTRTDRSGHAYTLSSAAGSGFANSPSYAPQAIISGWTTPRPAFRAATAAGFTLDSSSSVTFTGNGTPASRFWTVISPPGPVSFSSRTAATTTVKATISGQYTFRLQVTDDAGVSALTDQVIGVVATDANGILLTGNPRMDILLGPLVAHGVEEYPWWVKTYYAIVEALTPHHVVGPNEPANEAGTTTVSVDNPQPTVVGSGTSFTVRLSPGDLVWLKWDLNGDSTFAGRRLDSVSSVTDNTHFVQSDFYWGRPLPNSIAMPWSKPDGAELNDWTRQGQPGNSWNYYEALLGVYRLFFQTQNPVYQTQARTFCGLWMKYGLDSGYQITAPRNMGLLSMVACALDQHPEYWAMITRSMDILSTIYQFNPSSTVTSFPQTIDAREHSYITRFTVAIARLHPDSGVRATYCTALANQINRLWIPNQEALGYWAEDVFAQNPTGMLADIGGVFGTAPWRGVGLTALALMHAYDALVDTSSTGCNNPSLAVTLLPIITKAADFMWLYGRSGDGGIHGNILYATAQGGLGAALYAGTAPLAANEGGIPVVPIAVTHGSTTVTGTGSHFTTQILACDGTGWIGLWSVGTPADRKIYRVSSCTDTSLTLATPYAGATTNPVDYWSSALSAPSSCAPSLSPTCESVSGATGLTISQDSASVMAWMYQQTGTTSWKTRADYFGANMFGGPAGGPGTTGACGGTGCTTRIGTLGNFYYGLPPCGPASPPCGGAGITDFTNKGKVLGTHAGATDVPNYFAWRIGLSAPVSRTFKVGFRLADVAGSDNVLLTLTRPDGTTATATCVSSPCSIAADVRQGDHVLRLDRRASTTVLSRGANVVVGVQ